MISVEFLIKLMLNGETNLTCTTVTSQCDQFVAMVTNHYHLNDARVVEISVVTLKIVKIDLLGGDSDIENS